MLVPSLTANAAETSGLRFSHNDWELVCDNTRTCRAVGYHSDNDRDTLTVSVLLTRKAGSHQPVTGKLMLGNYGNDDLWNTFPPVLKLSMRINGRFIGHVTIQHNSATAELTARQVSALLAALPHNSDIEWVMGENCWRLSDKGATAVLLKMDEFQGRVGTQGALVRKGPLSEDLVLPPLPAPIVTVAHLAKTLPMDHQLVKSQSKALREALLTTLKEEDYCPDLEEGEANEYPLSVTRLTNAKLLISTSCWRGAYNFGYHIGFREPVA
jgi:hypothetical protein